MSSPDLTRVACKQSVICTDEKCLCEEYNELTPEAKIALFHEKQMNTLQEIIRGQHAI